MRNRRLLISVVLIVSSFSSLGWSENCVSTLHNFTPVEEINSAFNSLYARSEIYRPAQCGRNIKDLALAFENMDVTPKDPKVLMLLSEARRISNGPRIDSALMPHQSRRHDNSWLFHVVLQITDPLTQEPLILDLDGDRKAVPIGIYFSSLFPDSEGSGDRLTHIKIKPFQLGEYLQAFRDFQASLPLRGSHDENSVVGKLRSPKAFPERITTLRRYLADLISPIQQ